MRATAASWPTTSSQVCGRYFSASCMVRSSAGDGVVSAGLGCGTQISSGRQGQERPERPGVFASAGPIGTVGPVLAVTGPPAGGVRVDVVGRAVRLLQLVAEQLAVVVF